MAVPKFKKSRSNTHNRRSQWKATIASVIECPQCHKFKINHRLCMHCKVY